MEIPENKKMEVIRYFSSRLGAKIDGVEVVELIDIDGAKIVFDNGSWILARASGTEPIIRCYIESGDESFFDRLKDFANNAIKDICD